MEGRRARILIPTHTTSGLKVLLNKMTTLLKMINALNTVTPLESFTQDLGFLDVDPFLSHQMLPHLKHRYWVLVWVRWIEVVRRGLVEFHPVVLPTHLDRYPRFLSLLAYFLSLDSAVVEIISHSATKL
uniref:Uncharacterized protein n=1 Tax=Opuntia streptacantha TaxID=393608 RepID=A0A7C9DQB3_OPUST